METTTNAAKMPDPVWLAPSQERINIRATALSLAIEHVSLGAHPTGGIRKYSADEIIDEAALFENYMLHGKAQPSDGGVKE